MYFSKIIDYFSRMKFAPPQTPRKPPTFLRAAIKNATKKARSNQAQTPPNNARHKKSPVLFPQKDEATAKLYSILPDQISSNRIHNIAPHPVRIHIIIRFKTAPYIIKS